MRPLLILCLGNEVLSDDAFGYYMARKLLESDVGERADIIYASLAGFNLLDLFMERKRVLIIDAILTGHADAGTLHFFPIGELVPTRQLVSSHQISLPTALRLAELMDIEMPEVIEVMAIEAQDVWTLSEEMTEPIKQAVPDAFMRARQWVDKHAKESVSNGTREFVAAIPGGSAQSLSGMSGTRLGR